MKPFILQVIEEVLSPVEGGHDLLSALKAGTANVDQRKLVCSVLGSALIEHGLDADGEPTAKGVLIEAAIDEVNRPNLRPPTPDLPPSTSRG
jgi:hypothetical protein